MRFENKNQDTFSPLLVEVNSPDISTHIREMLAPKKWGTHVELLAAATYFQVPVYYLRSPSRNFKWEVFHPLGPVARFKYQLCPEVDTSSEDVVIPDHFELLLKAGNHYDSVISLSGSLCTSRPEIVQMNIDCSDIVLE